MAHHFFLDLFVHKLSILASFAKLIHLVLFRLVFITVIQLRFITSVGFGCFLLFQSVKHSQSNLDLVVVHEALLKLITASTVQSVDPQPIASLFVSDLQPIHLAELFGISPDPMAKPPKINQAECGNHCCQATQTSRSHYTAVPRVKSRLKPR